MVDAVVLSMLLSMLPAAVLAYLLAERAQEDATPRLATATPAPVRRSHPGTTEDAQRPDSTLTSFFREYTPVSRRTDHAGDAPGRLVAFTAPPIPETDELEVPEAVQAWHAHVVTMLDED